MARVTSALQILVAAVVLATSGCSRTEVTPGFIDRISALDPARFTCCADPERFYPQTVVDLAFPVIEALGPKVTQAVAGVRRDTPHPGKLTGKSEAIAAVTARLRPFDMIFIANKSHPGGQLVPGRFTHNYIHVGSEAELRALGLWSLPALAPHRAAIRAGETWVEAAAPATRTTTPEWALDVDGAVILRPALTAAQRRAALTRMMASLGTPYDFNFAADGAPGRLSCTELTDLTFPHLGLTVREAYGERVILPDDVVAQAIRGERMRVVAYVVGTEDGFDLRNIHSLMGDIAAYWGLPD